MAVSTNMCEQADGCSQIFSQLFGMFFCRQGLPARQTVVLDADRHSGWELARALLRPRRIVADAQGNVSFMRGGAQRIAVTAALKHPFIAQVRL